MEICLVIVGRRLTSEELLEIKPSLEIKQREDVIYKSMEIMRRTERRKDMKRRTEKERQEKRVQARKLCFKTFIIFKPNTHLPTYRL